METVSKRAIDQRNKILNPITGNEIQNLKDAAEDLRTQFDRIFNDGDLTPLESRIRGTLTLLEAYFLARKKNQYLDVDTESVAFLISSAIQDFNNLEKEIDLLCTDHIKTRSFLNSLSWDIIVRMTGK